MAVEKPTVIPLWAINGDNTTPPGAPKQDEGWTNGEPPASSFMNWNMNLYGRWIAWLNDFTTVISGIVENHTTYLANLNTDQVKNASSVDGTTTTAALNALNEQVEGNTGTIAGLENPIGSFLEHSAPGLEAAGKWLPCTGLTANKEEYSDLYSVIRETYNTGGEDSSEFRLPNRIGRVAVGAGVYRETLDGGATFDEYDYQVGETGGAAMHRLTVDEMPSHDHKYSSDTNQGAGSGVDESSTTGLNRSVTPTGGDDPHENRGPFIVSYFYIKAKK